MKAKRSFATTALVCGVAVASVLGGLYLIRNPGSTSASDPIVGGGGRAQLAVQKAKAKVDPKAEARRRAQEAKRARNQVEALEVQRRRAQDQAQRIRQAKNLAAARLAALGKVTASIRKERATRDAERRKYEGTPKEVARNLLEDHGWEIDDEWSCLEKLWNKESRWKTRAENPSSGAYGIPQALPGDRMASYGRDWRTNPITQIKWGLDYIEDRHGSPCGAWSRSKAKGWY
jgi:hypothetical protein